MTPEAAAAIIRDWLGATMRETGMSAKTWADRARVAPSTIHRALKTDYAFVTSSRTLAKLAAVANRPPPELNQSSAAPITPRFLRVRHKVQAGTWLEVDECAQVEPASPRPVVPDLRWEGVDQWLELVVGDSVDKEIPDGGFAHVVDAIAIGYEPKANDLVVVERSRGGGLLLERTIKQIALGPGGSIELHPISHNTRHRPLVLRDGVAAHEEITVQIVGLVVGAYRNFR